MLIKFELLDGNTQAVHPHTPTGNYVQFIGDQAMLFVVACWEGPAYYQTALPGYKADKAGMLDCEKGLHGRFWYVHFTKEMTLMQTNFEKCLDAFWTFDGVKLDSAPGEHFATSYGVTEFTWRDAVQQGIVSGDMDTAPISDYTKVLKALFWDKCRCDDLPAGVDLMVFNDATLSGETHAVEWLQRVVGCNDDGIIGPITLSRVKALHPQDIVERLYAADLKFLTALRNAPLYIKGWTRRENYMCDLAQRRIAGTA